MTDRPVQIHEALRWASLFLQEHNREQPVAEILLMHHLGMTRTQLIGSMREPLSASCFDSFQTDIKDHATTGVPVQHLTGKESFYGREFFVNQDVLVPRPETEELVLGVLNDLNKSEGFSKPIQLVDVGTGSGIIAITIKLEQPDVQVWASDLSGEALAVAKKNAKNLGADICFRQGDLLEPFIETANGNKVQVIVSNPPYIAYSDKASLSDSVKNYDPELALFADEDGLAAYKKIIKQSTEIVDNHALIAFEIGYQQGKQVSELIRDTYPQSKIEIRKDINGKDRMVVAEINRES